MALSSKDLKAVAWYAKEHNYRPQLSAPPMMYFKDQADTTIATELSFIKSEYESWHEDDMKNRARQRRYDAR